MEVVLVTDSTTVLAIRPPQEALATVEQALSVEQIVGQVRLIQDVMAGVMRDGEHYGTIPGARKKSLYKAGAEKLLMTFRIALEHEVEDLSTADMIRYRVRSRAISEGGRFLGEGIGECSSAEEKYAWRGIKAAGEWDATPESDRRIKWSMDGKKEIQAKQVRTSPLDFGNTVLKMAKKRADVDACLSVTAASDIFAQDLEDLPGTPGATASDSPAPAAAPSVVHAPAAAPVRAPVPTPTQESAPIASAAVVEMASHSVCRAIQLVLESLHVEEHAFVAQVLVPKGIHAIDEMTEAQATSLLTMLQAKRQAQTATE